MDFQSQDPPEKLGEFHHASTESGVLLPKPRFRHDVPIRSAAVPIDGSILAALDAKGDLLGWDARTARLRYRIPVLGKGEVLQRLSCSPDSRFLALSPAALPAGLVRVHDLATGKELRRIESCFDPAFSPDGEILAGTDGPQLRRWAVKSGAELPWLPPGVGALKWTAYSPKGDLVAASSEDTDDVIVWDLTTRQRVFRDLASSGGAAATSIAFSPDGKTFAAGSHWGVSFFQVTTQPAFHLQSHEDYAVGRLRFSPDGQRLLAQAPRRRLLVWNPYSGEPMFTWAPYLTPDGWLDVSEGGDIALWIERGGIRLERMPKILAGSADGHVVKRVSFDHENRVITGDDRGSIRIWDPLTQKEVKRFDVPLRNLRFFSRDGKWAAFGGGEDPVRIWNLQAGREQATIEAKPFVHAVAMSPDGRTLALGHLDGSVSLWDVGAGREKARIERDLDQICAVAWSADGKSLAWGDVAGSVVWAEGTAGRDPIQYKARREGPVRDLSFSSDGRTMIVVDERGQRWAYREDLGAEPVRIMDPSSGPASDHRWAASGFLQRRGKFCYGDEVFSPDGSVAVTMTGAGTILIWLAPGAK